MRCGGLTFAGCQMTTQLLSHSPSSMGQRENKIKKFMGQEKVTDIACQLLSWANQTQLGENQFDLLPIKIDLNGENQRPKLKWYLSVLFLCLSLPCQLLYHLG